MSSSGERVAAIDQSIKRRRPAVIRNGLLAAFFKKCPIDGIIMDGGGW